MRPALAGGAACGPPARDESQAMRPVRASPPRRGLPYALLKAFSASLMPSLTPTSLGSAFSAAAASLSL